MCNALGQCSRMVYHENGAVETTTNRRGQTITYAYDAAGRMTGKSWPSYDGQPAYSATYEYFSDGSIKTVTDSNGAVSYTYDNALLIERRPGRPLRVRW